jgi:uncharacterized protein YdaT
MGPVPVTGRDVHEGIVMSERKVYHVMPGSEDRWQIKGEGAQRATSLHDTKAEAVTRARELAKSLPLAQVIVHKQDGTIQTEYTYGEDPHPPEG